MTAIGFLSELHATFGGDYHRMVKIATGLRKLGLYPDTRLKGMESHVTVVQAAHFVRAVALNLNPYNETEFNDTAKEFKHLKNEKGDQFIHDLARLLTESGFYMTEQIAGDDTEGILARVHRISFSLDRPFVTIVRRNVIAGYNEEEGFYQSKGYTERETVYGKDLKVLPFERFAIIKRSALDHLSQALDFIPEKFSATAQIDPEIQKTRAYINTIK